MLNYLIIGGTGSLGNALVEQLLKVGYDPYFPNYKICIYSRDEHKQEQMARKFSNHAALRFLIGDIRDKDRLNLAIHGGVTHIINAAALKIVPAMEYNPFECLKTNTIGAQNVIDCLCNFGYYPIKFIQVSTDKAVKPINVYGASKLCAEKLTLAANNITGEMGHRYSVVRYGNVANSNGSVIPLFKKQLAANEPLTITDERMTRFWITLEDAATFVLECLHKMEGGETFIPKMPSFKVTDLARAMTDKPYIVTGIRPGEKLHESISDELSSDTNDNWLWMCELQDKLRAL
jgi:UDP-N-acetylglucosamine 4,6-dehydratase